MDKEFTILVAGLLTLIGLLVGGAYFMHQRSVEKTNQFINECVAAGNVVVPGYRYTLCVPPANAPGNYVPEAK